MKFGFDIDDTLINLREHAFQLYNKKLNKEIGLDVFHSLKTVEIHEAFGLTASEGGQMWNSSLDDIYYTSCPAFPYAVETLQELVKQDHEVYYVTARPKEHGERTMQWMIDKGFPVQKDRFFYGMKDSEKVGIIQELELDYFFDDKPTIIETLSDLPVKSFLKDTSYNKNIEMPRITCWSELKDVVKSNEK